MSYFYFFKNDGRCTWMSKEMDLQLPKFLYKPIEYNGKMVRFYLILNWIKNDIRGVNIEALRQTGVNFVENVTSLPKGAGILVSGYDSNVKELEEAKKNNIPIIERPCPWVRELRNQIMDTNADKYQCVIMIDKDHMVYECYKCIFPNNTIVVSPDDFKDKISKLRDGKPIKFMIYATFRPKDAEEVIHYINDNYSNPDNILDGYTKTLCNWTRQGLLEEMSSEISKQKLNEIWVICSSQGDRSTISILREANEAGAKTVIIKKVEDIPKRINNDSRIGVVLAPIPMAIRKHSIKQTIKERFL